MAVTVVQRLPFEQLLDVAQQHLAARRLVDARAALERVLRAAPRHPTILTMLGAIAYQQGDAALGEAWLDRALEVYGARAAAGLSDAAEAAAHANLLLARNRAAEAEARLAEANLPLNPVRMSAAAFAARRQAAQAAGLPPMLIVTVPKSASESIWNRLAEGPGLARSHVSIGLFPDCTLVPHRVGLFAAGGVIAKEHILPTPFNLSQLAAHGIDRLVVHVRDPRQATLSWAHFVRDHIARRPLAPIWRKIVPPATVLEKDLGNTVDWCLEHYLPRLVEFVRAWVGVGADPGAPLRLRILSFERFRADPSGYLTEVLAFYDIAPERCAADAAAEVVHLRKGAVDEWREVFSRVQRRRARELLPADLAAACGWRE